MLGGYQMSAVFQVSTLHALTEGWFDGFFTVGDLKKQGNTGLGTFHAFDGELIFLDGIAYQADGDGKIKEMPDSATLPYAVTTFLETRTEKSGEGDPISLENYSALRNYLREKIKDSHLPHVLKIHAAFEWIQTRSMWPYEKPYPGFDDVVKNHITLDSKNISGWMVGFRIPKIFKEVSAAGFHLHFVDDERTIGGHILDFEGCSIKGMQVEPRQGFRMELSPFSESP
jgi:acetolactate decarboxylase